MSKPYSSTTMVKALILGFVVAVLTVVVVKADAQELESRWTHGVMAGGVTVERSRDDGKVHAKAFNLAGYEWGVKAVQSGSFAWLTITNPHAVQFDSEQDKFAYLSGLRLSFLRGVLPGDADFGFGALVALADTEGQSGVFIDFDADYDVKYVFALGFPF